MLNGSYLEAFHAKFPINNDTSGVDVSACREIVYFTAAHDFDEVIKTV